MTPGPYIVTTKRQDEDDRNCDCFIPALEGAGQHSPGCACFKPRVASRVAVATLEEAREWARDYVLGVNQWTGLRGSTLHPDARQVEWLRLEREIRDLPESGGTITLPDGTVIKVEQTTWYALVAGWGEHWQREADRATGGDTEAQQRILDAFNAQEPKP